MTSIARHVGLTALGLVAGVAVGYWLVTDMNRHAVATYAAYELTEHEKAAVAAFAIPDPDAVLLVQDFVIAYANRQYETGWIDSAEYHRVVGYASARAAVALSEKGDSAGADDRLTQAVKELEQIGTRVAKQELLDVVMKARGQKPQPSP